MIIKDIIKRLVLTNLPDNVLKFAKRVYYARLLESVVEDHEVDLKLLRHLVSAGDFVVDIGANIGVYTKWLSRWVGEKGRVYSIEPVPVTFDILCSNVRKFGLANVEPIKCAISDGDGFVTMEVPLNDSGWENFYRARVVRGNPDGLLRRLRVESRKIDSLLSEVPNAISFIKCDAEGNDLNCIKGAIRTTRKSMPAWLIEILGDPDDHRSADYEIIRLLGEYGYGVYWFDGTKVIKRRPGDKSLNYWFLMPKHVRKLQGKNLIIDS